MVRRRGGLLRRARRRHGEQVSGLRDIGRAAGIGEQAVVTDAVEAFGQDVQQEAADELVGGKRHGAVALVHRRDGNPCNGR